MMKVGVLLLKILKRWMFLALWKYSDGLQKSIRYIITRWLVGWSPISMGSKSCQSVC